MLDSLYQLIARAGFPDPLHAPITHIPIGLVIGAFLFFLVAIIFGRKNLITTARHVSILAFIFVFPTILFGVMDWMHYYHAALIFPIKMKMILASSVLVILAAGIVVGSEIKVRSAPMVVLYALAFVAVVGLGWYGARLVYGGFSPAAVQSTQAAQPAAGTKPGTATAAAPSAAGQKIFADNCSACHPNGSNVVVESLPLKKAKQLASQATFVAFIRDPKMPDGSAGSMPAFPADQISDRQAGELFSYVTSMLPSWK
ncbi:MAG: c-type cytochrome [Spirochaetia bacterium]|jgi:mono/diheme cytochrome c family protein